MESGLEIDDGNETKGGMWVLDQKLDQPMEEEAGSLRNMYREKGLIDYKNSRLYCFAACIPESGSSVWRLGNISIGHLCTLFITLSTCQSQNNPNQHRTDEELTTYSRSTFHELSFAAKTKRWPEANTFRKNALLILVLVGTCMVVGDGILTPAISGTNAHPIVEESIQQSSKQFSIGDLKKKATIGIVLRLKTH